MQQLSSIIVLTLVGPFLSCCSSSLAKVENKMTTHVATPEILSQMPPEEIDKVRVRPITPPLGTSTFHISRLAQQEIEVAEKLDDLAGLFGNIQRVLQRYASSWREISESGIAKEEGWAEHPLHAYALAKHISLGWPAIEYALSHLKDSVSDMEWLLERRNRSGVPTTEDLTAVAGGLARLHDFYSLNLTALSHSQILSQLSVQPVTAKITPTVWDLYRIGKEAVRVNIWNSGVDFLRAALDRYNTSTSSPTMSRASSSSSYSMSQYGTEHPYDNAKDIVQIPEAFLKAAKMHDQVLERKGCRTRKHSTHQKPLDKTLARKKKYHKKKETILGHPGSTQQALSQYVSLCRGTDLRPTNETSVLYCRYISNGSPWYVIGPLRMEVHSLNPYVVTIEGVVTPKETEEIKETASSLLEKSSTFRYNGLSEVSDQRTSSTAWIWEHDSEHMPTLSARIEALTGLNTQQHLAAETYQAVNYGVGGHYTVHHDSTTISLPFNRIATFLLYLTDVTLGGSTVFPWLGFGVQPKRGMALLWYNLKKAGARDERLEHAACPVLFGDKWIMNKWLAYGAQFNRVLCNVIDKEAHIVQPLT